MPPNTQNLADFDLSRMVNWDAPTETTTRPMSTYVAGPRRVSGRNLRRRTQKNRDTDQAAREMAGASH